MLFHVGTQIRASKAPSQTNKTPSNSKAQEPQTPRFAPADHHTLSYPTPAATSLRISSRHRPKEGPSRDAVSKNRPVSSPPSPSFEAIALPPLPFLILTAPLRSPPGDNRRPDVHLSAHPHRRTRRPLQGP